MHDGHGHEHIHEHGENDLKKNLALLTYMLDHNRHHAAELHELAHSLFHAGEAEAAEMIEDGIKYMNMGNDKLEAALNRINKED